MAEIILIFLVVWYFIEDCTDRPLVESQNQKNKPLVESQNQKIGRMTEATEEAIGRHLFEEARTIIAGIPDIEIAAHLEALCFHDYLYVRLPPKSEAEYYIAQAFSPIAKDMMVEDYAFYRKFEILFSDGPIPLWKP